MPNNCIFLVDTYDTLQGVRNAAVIGQELRRQGHEMIGIRLDSGDLAWLSIEAREILDEAGFPNAVILASNDLDENIIASLKDQGAKIDAWGVGTRLVTAHDDPALGGVYKLSAIRRPGGPWEPKMKLSEQAVKISNPGVLQVRRYRRDGECAGDVIFDEEHPIRRRLHDGRSVRRDPPQDHAQRRRLRRSFSADLPARTKSLSISGIGNHPSANRATTRQFPRRNQTLRQPAPISRRPGTGAQ